ncbi:carbohydrate ABC transporter permease [Paenibacillus nasutitermitis]|uniref:Bicyclomycin resistance protein n=1 Tax=Paenibacillus nasutitermitis TaxID=1652958 RepID=A0A916YTR4_9BACL|nr:sugar ABC transporter permease [Paenibacillus nasutitermitis]GGD61369.1 bicyclomycin resistance protein [Paenibacillus nasutitermitis]
MFTIKKARSLSTVTAPYVFIGPSMLFIIVLSILPILYSFYLSFLSYNLSMPASTIKFFGLQNYSYILTDKTFLGSIAWTLSFSIIVVALNVIVGMSLALLLNGSLMERASSVFKTIFILPMMLAHVVTATIWKLMFSPVYGIINNVLVMLGFNKVNWIADTENARFSLIIVELWGSTPFCMLIFLAALKTVPKELYESALIDGANRIRTFFGITLPLIRNFLALVVSIRIMDSLRMFDIVYTLTNGGPGNDTETIGTTIYKTAFRYSDIGAGSAGAFIFFILIVIVTLVFLKLIRKESKD